MAQQPRAYIFSGANASGKSTITAFLFKEGLIKGQYINADLILKEELKSEETKENYLKAFRIEVKRLNEAIKNKKDIVLEIVASKNIINKLKENGYYITYFFIGTANPKINAVYLTQRVSEGGHDVAIKDLIRRWEQNLKNLNEIASKVDCLILMDNSGYLKYPVLLKSYFKNKLCYVNSEIELNKIEWLKFLNADDEKMIKNQNNESYIFCEMLKESLIEYKEILIKDYKEKNQILLNYSKPDRPELKQINKTKYFKIKR